MYQNLFKHPGTVPLISFLVGLILTIIINLFNNSTNSLIIRCILFFATSIYMLQLGELFKRNYLAQKFSKIESALQIGDKYFSVRIMEIIEKYEMVCNQKNAHKKISKFIEEKETKLFDNLIQGLQELEIGRVTISTDQELTLNKDFLLQLPTSKVCAVSYQDDAFWQLDEGKKFLNAHTKIIDENNVEVKRIFLVENSGCWPYDILNNQIENGIKVYIFQSDGDNFEDFVMYDDCFVRYARRVDNSNTKKYATLSMNKSDLNKYKIKFSNFLERSTRVDIGLIERHRSQIQGQE